MCNKIKLNGADFRSSCPKSRAKIKAQHCKAEIRLGFSAVALHLVPEFEDVMNKTNTEVSQTFRTQFGGISLQLKVREKRLSVIK